MMKIIAGTVDDNLTLSEQQIRINGLVSGTLRIQGTASVELNGLLSGNAIIEFGKLTINGMVRGNVVNSGGELEVYGLIRGSLKKQGGTTHIGPNAVIQDLRN